MESYVYLQRIQFQWVLPLCLLQIISVPDHQSLNWIKYFVMTSILHLPTLWTQQKKVAPFQLSISWSRMSFFIVMLSIWYYKTWSLHCVYLFICLGAKERSEQMKKWGGIVTPPFHVGPDVFFSRRVSPREFFCPHCICFHLPHPRSNLPDQSTGTIASTTLVHRK